MNCNKCNKENNSDSKFCRFCGSKLDSTRVSFNIKLPDFSGLIGIIRKQNKKAIIIAILVVIIGAGTVFAAPKINDYIKVNGFINEALKLESAGDYQAALASLVLADNRWTLESKKQEINDLKEAQAKYTKFKDTFAAALEKEEDGKLAEARELLQSIGSDYPKYEEVREKISKLQEAIENDLREQARAKELEAQRQAAAAAEARRRADAEAAAKARAEAEKAASEAQARAAAEAARQAEIQRQAAEAQARAAAEAARQAEVRRQQEEAERIRQVRISFLNQLVTIYNSLNGDGITYYNRAMGYYNAGYDLTAISVFGQANAIFQKAYSDARSLQANFTGLQSSYINAANNMATAANYCIQAVSAAVNETGLANTYANSCASYRSLVDSFLSSEGY